MRPTKCQKTARTGGQGEERGEMEGGGPSARGKWGEKKYEELYVAKRGASGKNGTGKNQRGGNKQPSSVMINQDRQKKDG